MKTNNKKFLAPFFVAMSMLLVACSSDTIVARPQWQDDSIIDVDGLKNNKLKEIYDAVKGLSETNPNILNKVMFSIAKKQIGSYKELYDIVIKNVEFKKFVDDHPIYKAENKTFYIKNGKTVSEEVKEGSDLAYKISKNKIINQFNKIKDTIFEKLYNDVVKSADYANDGKLFQEEYFVRDYLVPNMYVKNSEIKGKDFLNDKLVMPKEENKSWEEFIKNYLSIFDENGECGFNSIYYKKDDEGYIGRKILPEIYRTLLVDTYVREQRYSNLGRAQARKVNMITVPRVGIEYDSKIKNMLLRFAEKYICDDESETFDFELVKRAMIGFIEEKTGETEKTPEEELLSPTDQTAVSRFSHVTIPGSTGRINVIWEAYTDENGKTLTKEERANHRMEVYDGTKLGDLVKKYISINNVTATIASGKTTFKYTLKNLTDMSDDQKSFFNELTNNGKRLPEDGLIIKERELRTTDMTIDGWFLKDGGLTELEDEYRTNLFSVNTVNIIDNEKEHTEFKAEDNVRYVGNNAFLTNSKATEEEDVSNSIIAETDKNYYIVNVQEAANTKKLSSISESGNYLEIKAGENAGDSNKAMDEIVSNIVKKAADSDTYKKNAEQYYLMISNIVINDDSVYEYFKSQFPDLFK